MTSAPFRILFVCLGNICRSPTAHGVLEYHLRRLDWQSRVEVDSAGTHNHHPQSAPDLRTQRHALQRGYDLSNLRARQIQLEDFERFDLILAMDLQNLNSTTSICPLVHQKKIKPFASFFKTHTDPWVPDPYYGGKVGFEHVLDLIEDGVESLLGDLKAKLGLP